MPILYGHIWRDEVIKALIKLRAVDKTYEQRVIFKKFGTAIDAERKLVLETAIQPNVKAFSPESPDLNVLKEVNEFLSKECELKPLPFEFHDIMKKAVLSEIDEEFLKPLIAEKVHLAEVA